MIDGRRIIHPVDSHSVRGTRGNSQIHDCHEGYCPKEHSLSRRAIHPRASKST